eukprot:245204-Lingulodinium_polyedra.AAC.1
MDAWPARDRGRRAIEWPLNGHQLVVQSPLVCHWLAIGRPFNGRALAMAIHGFGRTAVAARWPYARGHAADCQWPYSH